MFKIVLTCLGSTYPSAQYLVDSCTLFECALSHHLGSHLLHIQHECIQRFLDVWLFFVCNKKQSLLNSSKRWIPCTDSNKWVTSTYTVQYKVNVNLVSKFRTTGHQSGMFFDLLTIISSLCSKSKLLPCCQ